MDYSTPNDPLGYYETEDDAGDSMRKSVEKVVSIMQDILSCRDCFIESKITGRHCPEHEGVWEDIKAKNRSQRESDG